MKLACFTVLLFAILGLAACKSDSTTPGSNVLAPAPIENSNPENGPAETEGGISSGGGGTLPAEPAQVWDIKEHAESALRDIRLMLVLNMNQYQNKKEDYDKWRIKVLGNPEKTLRLLETVKLDLREDRPCYDAHGKEVDGSADLKNNDTVCISAFRIAPKVAKALARNEVIALVAHEISHLLGTNEEEAVDLQKDVLFMMEYDKITEFTSAQMISKLEDAARDASYGAKDLANSIDSMDQEALYKKMSSLQDSIFQFWQSAQSITMGIYLKPQEDYLEVQYSRYMVALWEVIARGNDFYAKDMAEKLNRIFKDQKTVQYSQFQRFENYTPVKENKWGNEIISRVSNNEELKQYLLALSAYMNEQSNYAFSFQYNNPLPVLENGPWSQIAESNPWEKFMGQYQVQSVECKLNGAPTTKYFQDLREIWIHKPDYNATKLYLREITSNGYGDSGLHNNGPMVHANTTIVEGDSTSATRRGTLGSPWAGNYNLTVDRFSQQGSTFILHHLRQERSQYQSQMHQLECEIKFTKE